MGGFVHLHVHSEYSCLLYTSRKLVIWIFCDRTVISSCWSGRLKNFRWQGGRFLRVEVCRRWRRNASVSYTHLADMAEKNAREALKRKEQSEIRAYERSVGAAKKLGEILGIGYIRRMECYDISNTQGTDSVASMVVFIDGKPDKKEYRRFRIKTVQGANDFASMAEALERRIREGFKAEDKERGFGAVPDLIVVDLSLIHIYYTGL